MSNTHWILKTYRKKNVRPLNNILNTEMLKSIFLICWVRVYYKLHFLFLMKLLDDAKLHCVAHIIFLLHGTALTSASALSSSGYLKRMCHLAVCLQMMMAISFP